MQPALTAQQKEHNLRLKMQNLRHLTYLESTTTGANIVGAPTHVHGPECTCNLAIDPDRFQVCDAEGNLSSNFTMSPSQYAKESRSVRNSNNKNEYHIMNIAK